MKVLKSSLDESVNFVVPHGKGYLEARYVRRKPEYFICYLSSQSGCNRGCQMCHLTTTGQTMFDQASSLDFLGQSLRVLEYYDTQPKANIVHYNWMARGEALCNPTITEDFLDLGVNLTKRSTARGLSPKFNVSTIMPRTLNKSLVETFRGINPTIYYSVYSMKDRFRDKWLPGAMNPHTAFDLLAEYQRVTGKIIKIHHALIEGENDSIHDAYEIADAIESRNLAVSLNLVRYNSPDSLYKESSKYNSYLMAFKGTKLLKDAKIVGRVGEDVKASCGTFVTGDDL